MSSININDDKENDPIFDIKEEPVKEKKEAKSNAVVPILSIEEKLAIQSLKNKIDKWKIAFPKITKSFKYDQYTQYQDLVDLEKQIEFSVSSHNGGAIIQTAVLGTAGVAENFGHLYGLKLQGYQSLLANDATFRNTLLELECKYSDQVHSNVWGRLVSTMVYSGTLVHFNNCQREVQNMEDKINKKAEDPNINEKYKDL